MTWVGRIVVQIECDHLTSCSIEIILKNRIILSYHIIPISYWNLPPTNDYIFASSYYYHVIIFHIFISSHFHQIILIRSDSTIVAPYERWQYHHPSTYSMPLQVQQKTYFFQLTSDISLNMVTYIYSHLDLL